MMLIIYQTFPALPSTPGATRAEQVGQVDGQRAAPAQAIIAARALAVREEAAPGPRHIAPMTMGLEDARLPDARPLQLPRPKA